MVRGEPDLRRVVSRWLDVHVPRAPLPVALVATMRAGDSALTGSGERLVVESVSEREVRARIRDLTLRVSSISGPFTWAYMLAPLLVWLNE